MKHEGKTAVATINPDDLKIGLANDLQQAVEQIKSCLSTDDLEQFKSEDEQAVCLYLDTIIDETRFYKEIGSLFDSFATNPENWKKWFPSGKLVSQLDQTVEDGLNGHVLLLHSQLTGRVLSIALKHIPSRSIEEPKVEKIVIGPKDSFVEDFKSNLSLIRRWVRDPNLAIRYFQVGRRSKSKVALCYLKDIANPDWIKEIETRLESIDVDFIVGHKDVMDLLIRRTLTPFPLYQLTEIPARCQFEMSVGRIVLIVEGSPYGIVLPAPLISMFREAEYLMQSGIVRTFARFIRFLSAFLSMYSAAIYVALVSVNTSILPTEFSLTIAKDQLQLP